MISYKFHSMKTFLFVVMFFVVVYLFGGGGRGVALLVWVVKLDLSRVVSEEVPAGIK